MEAASATNPKNGNWRLKIAFYQVSELANLQKHSFPLVVAAHGRVLPLRPPRRDSVKWMADTRILASDMLNSAQELIPGARGSARHTADSRTAGEGKITPPRSENLRSRLLPSKLGDFVHSGEAD